MAIPEGLAIIIRTAGIGVDITDLKYDFKILCDIWENIDKSVKNTNTSQLIYKEPNIIIRTIRDHCTNNISLIIIDNINECHQAMHYFKKYMPGMEQIIVYYNKFKPIFDYYGLIPEIDQLYNSKVNLV